MKYQPWKRALCCLLTAVLIFGNIPIFSFAEESDGFCPHHSAHTDQCGYAPVSPGSPCTHEHTEDCYQTVTKCVHAHDDTCGYVSAVEGHGCDCVPDAEGVLTHAEDCGYVEAVEEVPCGHVCSVESGCVTRELVCPHSHDGSCGYIAPTSEQPCTYVCQACADSKAAEGVQALIDALPTLEEVKAMSIDEQAKAYNQVQSAYDAYEALTESQKALIVSAESTFGPLFDYFNSLTAPAANVLDSGSCGANLTWALTDDGVLTISGTGSMTDYSNANSTPWYSHLSDIKQIIIKDGVTSIGSYAFGGVTYPNAPSATVPTSVTGLGLYAFGGNIQIHYPGTMAQWLSLDFYYGSSVWSAPGAVCSDGTILTHGYCGTYGVSGSPKYVLTSDGCMRIYGTGNMAFSKNLNNTSHWASYNSSITSVVVEDGVTSIADYSFDGCQNLTQVSLPDNLRVIGNYAFRGCTALKAIDIPSTVTYLGSGVFQSSGLESIEIPEGVKYMKDYSFLDCTSLRSVTIPVSVTNIGDQAFYNCTALTDVYYSGSEQTWNQITISSNNDPLLSAKIHYTNPCVNGHQFNSNGFCTVCGAFGGTCGDNLTWVFTDDGVLTISGTGAMWDYDAASRTPWYSKMSSIQSLVLPAGITHIGKNAFNGSALTSVSFGNLSLSLGNYSFANCASLTSIDFGSGTIRPGEYVFDHCTALTSVSVPANVTMNGTNSGIGSGYGMFRWCTGLETATVACAYVGPKFFEDCSAMTKAIFTNTDVQFYFLEKKDDHPFHSTGNPMHVTVEGYLCSKANVLVQQSQGRYYLDLTFSQIAGDTTQHTEQVLHGTATCTDAGLSEGKVCSVCGYVIEKQTSMDALGHDLQSHDAQAATCTEKGWEAYDTCSRCNYTTYQEIPATGHDLSHVASTDATCAKEGVKEHYHCKSCGKNFQDEAGTQEMSDITIPTTSHTLSRVDGTDATCTAAGTVAHYHCSVCQKNFEDANGTTELTTVTTPTAAHNLSPVEGKAATCTEEGVEAHYNCSVCDKNFEDENGTTELTTVSIPAAHALSPVAEKAATCTEAGNIAHYHCSVCQKNFEDENGTNELSDISIPTAEHDWGEWAVTTPATPEADGVETRKCAVCQTEETRPLVYSGNRLVLTGTELENQSTVWIDGAPVSVQTDDAGNPYVDLPEGASPILVTYSFNTGSGDRHTQYPTGMNVYRVETTDSGLTVKHLPELQNLLQYSGCSIRITGNKGIRMITSINKSTRSALMGDGLAGYTLVEYGTALCRASALAGGAPLVLGTAGVKSNHAYKQGVADPIFKDTGSLIQYTNVLVGFTDEDCKEDIAMRPYIILADEKGEAVTIYGGVVYRSIGYIAWQNRNAFTPGSAAYEYVWTIIRYVYGDQYDADYKG